MSKAIAVVSGGLDSTTLAYLLHAEGYELHLLAFDYGQRHRKELAFAERSARRLKAAFDLIDLSNIGKFLKGSALTDDIAVPDGHYAAPTMAITVVPNRNAIMLDIAVAVAVTAGCDAVAFGAHGGDHVIYPDCRPAFVDAFAASAQLGNEGFLADGFRVLAPFLRLGKADIVRLGASGGVPFERTWSCYAGGARHCGTCGTCTERREAFQLAGIPDPTRYAAA